MPPTDFDNDSPDSLSPMMKVVFDFVIEADLHGEKLEGDDLVRIEFEGDNGQWLCFVQVNEEDSQCMVYSTFPTLTPEEKRLTMAEFITRANHGLLMGNFDLDFEDGEVRYKTGIDVMEDRLSLPLFRSLMINNLAMMDQYWPGIEAILNSDVSPAQAVADLEEEE